MNDENLNEEYKKKIDDAELYWGDTENLPNTENYDLTEDTTWNNKYHEDIIETNMFSKNQKKQKETIENYEDIENNENDSELENIENEENDSIDNVNKLLKKYKKAEEKTYNTKKKLSKLCFILAIIAALLSAGSRIRDEFNKNNTPNKGEDIQKIKDIVNDINIDKMENMSEDEINTYLNDIAEKYISTQEDEEYKSTGNLSKYQYNTKLSSIKEISLSQKGHYYVGKDIPEGCGRISIKKEDNQGSVLLYNEDKSSIFKLNDGDYIYLKSGDIIQIYDGIEIFIKYEKINN